MLSTRRTFLTSCATVVTTGCVARGGPSPTYQLVGGVEWKTIRGLRDNTLTKIAQMIRLMAPSVTLPRVLYRYERHRTTTRSLTWLGRDHWS